MISDKRLCVTNIYRLVVIFAITSTAAGQAAKAIAVLSSNKGVTGTIWFSQEYDQITVVYGEVAGLQPGFHGIHVHSNGDISNNCKNTGHHLNPANLQHGAPEDANRHAGDLGNIDVGNDGKAKFTIKDWQIPIIGVDSIIGRSIVIHALRDDLGRGGNLESKITGNAGEKIACAVIGIEDTQT